MDRPANWRHMIEFCGEVYAGGGAGGPLEAVGLNPCET